MASTIGSHGTALGLPHSRMEYKRSTGHAYLAANTSSGNARALVGGDTVTRRTLCDDWAKAGTLCRSRFVSVTDIPLETELKSARSKLFASRCTGESWTDHCEVNSELAWK